MQSQLLLLKLFVPAEIFQMLFFANPLLTQVCQWSNVHLSATGTGNFLWKGPLGWTSINQNPVISNIPPQMSGIYTVKLTSAAGFSSSADIEVKVYNQVNVSATATPQSVCEGQTLQLHATGGTKYLWVGPLGFTSELASPNIHNFTAEYAGTYFVYVSNEGGCYDYASVDVTVLPAKRLITYASPNPVIESGNVQLFTGSGTNYSWTGPLNYTSNSQNPLIKKVTRQMAGLYTVSVTNDNGCISTGKVTLKVLTNNGSFDGEQELDTRSDNKDHVYPNPTNNFLYFSTAKTGPIEYFIYDASGNLKITPSITSDGYINTEGLATGVYEIRWKNKDSEEWNVDRFVKIR